tara:strand:+ start:791 stop:1222 length:432 start_codon:yes stop_codon:yes gene_type:complete
MRWLFLLVLVCPSYVKAGSITPRFTTGQMESTSRSVQTIVETVVTQNYRSGYSYSVSGHNVQITNLESITPDAIYTDTQTAGGVSFKWVTPDIDNKPQWGVVNAGESFSLTESFLAPGLDAVSTVQREINTETNTTSLSIFSH